MKNSRPRKPQSSKKSLKNWFLKPEAKRLKAYFSLAFKTLQPTSIFLFRAAHHSSCSNVTLCKVRAVPAGNKSFIILFI